MFDYSLYSEKTYNELIREFDRLEGEYTLIETQCLKDNLEFSKFCEKAHSVKEKMFYIDKYIRLKQEPTITYGKDWDGELIEFDEFRKKCNSMYFTDEDGHGSYASESSKSDILVFPSDITENIFRTDFPYVIWFDKG